MDFGLVIGGVGRCGMKQNFHMAHVWVVILRISRMDRCPERHYVDGERDGKEVYYYENGQVEAELHYVDGKLDGKWVEYDEEGNITDEDIYRDDECVELCEERD